MGTKDPTGAENKMAGSAGDESILPSKLRAALNAEWIGRICFHVGPGFRAVEKIVRRVVDD